jgi:glucosylceramidase
MNPRPVIVSTFLTILIASGFGHGWSVNAAPGLEWWLTDSDKGVLFQKQLVAPQFVQTETNTQIIVPDETKAFQEIDGFGYTLTGGSAKHIIKMATDSRKALLQELFAIDSTNIGVSYLRVSIGASDLNDHAFSYNDLPTGETDPELAKFSFGPDRADVIPVLKEILAINPGLKIMGSPWSAPVWMKTHPDFRGGSLKPEYYEAYAKYFVKYLQGMAAERIPIDAITIQNEPLHPGNNPSMFMSSDQQTEFVKRHLGPALKAARLNTRIVIYDHNADRPDYPISILNDAEARQYIDGSAFHLYGGKIEALSAVHEAHPDKNLYFTEQWIGGPGNLKGDLAWHVKHLIIGATRNWCRTVLEWNLAANSKYEPHTDRGGCTRCLGAITIDGNEVTRNPAYYIIAHASKFVRPGSIRIASNLVEGLPSVAFRAPDGRKVVVVLNETKAPQAFALQQGDKSARVSLSPGAVATYVW